MNDSTVEDYEDVAVDEDEEEAAVDDSVSQSLGGADVGGGESAGMKEVVKMWWRMPVTEDSWLEVLLTYLASTATVQSVPALESILNKLANQQVKIDAATGRALVGTQQLKLAATQDELE